MTRHIRPDAQLRVTQPCEHCDGSGIADLQCWCRQCGHVYSQADLEQESKDWNGEDIPDQQPCGCDWRYRHGQDTCRECAGEGRVTLEITLRELAEALTALRDALARS